MIIEKQLESRILAGRYTGGVVTLPTNPILYIGYEFSNDIVLRTPGVKGNRIELTIAADTAQLRVVEGNIDVLGQTLSVGATMLLPHYTPVLIGGEHIAFGYAGAAEWDRTLALARAPRLTQNPDPQPETLPEQNTPWTRRFLGGAPDRNPIFARPVLAAATALSVMLFFGLKDANIAEYMGVEYSAPQVKAELATLGGKDLQVEKNGKTFTVSGFVDTRAQAKKITARLSQSGHPIKLQLATGPEMAQAVSDALRVQGVKGETRYLGKRKVEVTTIALEPAQMAAIEKNIRRDVPGLRDIYFRNGIGTGFSGMNGLATATSNPGKRISSLVAGNTGYLVTADGGRYFVGAVLPTGHQIKSIEGSQVILEQNGAAVRWIF
jgi:type III secretion protein D